MEGGEAAEEASANRFNSRPSFPNLALEAMQLSPSLICVCLHRRVVFEFHSNRCAALASQYRQKSLTWLCEACILWAIFVQLRFAVLLDSHAAVNVTVYFIFCTSFNGLTYLMTPNGDDNEISKHQRNDL